MHQARGTGQVFYGEGLGAFRYTWRQGQFNRPCGLAIYGCDPAYSYGDYVFRGLVPPW
jgi:hypothetical protein